MTVVEVPSGAHRTQTSLGGRFRLDERISLDDQVSGPCGSSWEARGLSLWKATDQLLGRPVTIYLLPPGLPVPRTIIDAVQSAAKGLDIAGDDLEGGDLAVLDLGYPGDAHAHGGGDLLLGQAELLAGLVGLRL